MTAVRLSRRALLRGAGAAIALPLLDAMLDRRGLLQGVAHAQGTTRPRRLVTFFYGDGTLYSQRGAGDIFTPATTGAGYTPSPALGALGDVIGDVNAITGLTNTAAAMSGFDVGCSHRQMAGAIIAGRPIRSESQVGGPSVDQVAAAQLGGATRLPSIPIAIWEASSRFNMPLSVNLSWNASGSPVPPRRDARLLFRDLFGTTAPTTTPSDADIAMRGRQSVLDQVQRDIMRLQTRLGARDRQALDQHLTAVREVERTLQAPAPTCMRPATEPRAGESTEATRLAQIDTMLRLLVLAMQCDLTRFASFQLTPVANDTALPWLSLGGSQHEISHDSSRRDEILRYTRWQFEQFAALLRLMKAVPEGDGTLLDSTLAVMFSEIGDGELHDARMPILLGGRGGGMVPTGRHIRYPEGTPVNRLFATMLRVVGVENARFGIDGDEPLTGLTS
jgi:hypothetical protein